ncbi:MAG: hypothetical protein ABW189_08620 [Rickettsiales bacterium]
MRVGASLAMVILCAPFVARADATIDLPVIYDDSIIGQTPFKPGENGREERIDAVTLSELLNKYGSRLAP